MWQKVLHKTNLVLRFGDNQIRCDITSTIHRFQASKKRSGVVGTSAYFYMHQSEIPIFLASIYVRLGEVRSIWKYVHAHFADDFDFFHIGGHDLYVLPQVGHGGHRAPFVVPTPVRWATTGARARRTAGVKRRRLAVMRAAPPQNLRDHLATYATAAAADPASAGGAAATYPPLFLGRRFREYGAAAICDTQRVWQLLVVVKRRYSYH